MNDITFLKKLIHNYEALINNGGLPSDSPLIQQAHHLLSQLRKDLSIHLRHQKLYTAIEILFPQYEQYLRDGEPWYSLYEENRPLCYPFKTWLNGATIKEYKLNDDMSYDVIVESYVGGNQYDDLELTIAAEWIDAPDQKQVIHQWIEQQRELIEQRAHLKKLEKARRALDIAQQNLELLLDRRE